MEDKMKKKFKIIWEEKHTQIIEARNLKGATKKADKLKSSLKTLEGYLHYEIKELTNERKNETNR